MNAAEKTLVELDTSPGELRKLAAEMVKLYDESRSGSTIPPIEVQCYDHVNKRHMVLRFRLDVKEYQREVSTGKTNG